MVEKEVTTTYLEMTDASQAPVFSKQRRLEYRRAAIASPELSRFFYHAVGWQWWWYSRLSWSRDQWLAHLERPGVETWIAYLAGTPAGFFELERRTGTGVELVYFGLLPSFIGMGLGREFLSAAIDQAWSSEPNRVWLHTCDLDHPRALPNYLKSGFEIYKTEDKIENLPDEPLDYWS